MKKAALHNLGCKVNAYETEAMQQMLEEAGYEIVPFSEKADVYVINTCSVTNMADRKSRQMLHRAKKLNPDAAVVAAGCYVQTKENEAKCDEAIDILIGNNQKKELVERLDAFFAGRGEKVEAVVDINHEKQAFEELTLDHAAEHTRAFIKVQDGCNQFCSYCIIPYARGRVRSRNVQNVLEEVKRLAASGYQEVVLTGCCIMKPEILAPGTNIVSLDHHGALYSRKSGTSMATPVVCGALALALQKNPKLRPEELKLKLYESARKETGMSMAWGVLDVDNLLALV